MKRSAGFIFFIFGDIKQIVAARSVVNIKISFVVQAASVSCSLSESQQPSFFFLFFGLLSDFKDRHTTTYYSLMERFQMFNLTNLGFVLGFFPPLCSDARRRGKKKRGFGSKLGPHAVV